jgi:hypothetical protein
MSVISLRLPDSVHERAREVAREENISINRSRLRWRKLCAARRITWSSARRATAVSTRHVKVPDVAPIEVP